MGPNVITVAATKHEHYVHCCTLLEAQNCSPGTENVIRFLVQENWREHSFYLAE